MEERIRNLESQLLDAELVDEEGNPLITNKAGSGRRQYRTDLVPGAGGSGALMIPNT